jgi:hypothetical protein
MVGCCPAKTNRTGVFGASNVRIGKTASRTQTRNDESNMVESGSKRVAA